MVNVTHDSNHRSTLYSIFQAFVVISFFISILLKIDKFYFTVKFTSHQLYHLCIETLVDRYHNTQAHTFTNHLGEWHIEQGCQDRKSTRLNSSHVKISYAVY